MLLAVEEQIFAMLADALLKQTERKKQGRGKKPQNKTPTKNQYLQMSECSLKENKTLNCIHDQVL